MHLPSKYAISATAWFVVHHSMLDRICIAPVIGASWQDFICYVVVRHVNNSIIVGSPEKHE